MILPGLVENPVQNEAAKTKTLTKNQRIPEENQYTVVTVVTVVKIHPTHLSPPWFAYIKIYMQKSLSRCI
jgi:hypothetical protein